MMRCEPRNPSSSRSDPPATAHYAHNRAGQDMTSTVDAPTSSGRAGRNLPVALVIGLGLGALVLVPLYTVKPVFLGVIAVAILVGLWELVRALHTQELNAPFIPLAVGVCFILAL